MKVGDVWLYEGEHLLVGNVNVLGGVCDDCSSDCEKGELLGNIFELDKMVELLGKLEQSNSL